MVMRMRIGVCALVAILALWAGADAFAQTPSAGVFDDVMTAYQSRVGAWESVVKYHATNLYWGLVLMSMVWTFGLLALKRADLGEFLTEFIKFVATVGFFFWILDNGPVFANAIIASMRQIAGDASGLGSGVSAQTLLDAGFSVADLVFKASSITAPVDSAVLMILGVACLLMCAYVGTCVVVTMIGAWILAYAGIFYLGFGGGRWTTDIAINYYKAVLQIGGQLMTAILLIGIGIDIVTTTTGSLGTTVTLHGIAVLLVVMLVFCVLIVTVPGMVGTVVAGGQIHTPLGGGFGGGGLGAGVGMMGAGLGAAALGGNMIGAGLTNAMAGAMAAGGGANAVMAAFGAASEAAKTGSGMFEGGAWGGGGNAAVQALGQAAQYTAEAGRQLGEAGFHMGKEAVSAAWNEKSGEFSDGVNKSVGSRLGEQIKGPSGDGGSTEKAAMLNAVSAFDPNGGEGGSTTPGWRDVLAPGASGSAGNGVTMGRPGGGPGGGASLDRSGTTPWMATTGGVLGLSPEQIESAQKSYAAWRDQGGQHSFTNYVEYVQEQEARRRGGGNG